MNGKNVGATVKVRTIRDIEEGFCVSAEGTLHEGAVEIEFRIYRRAFKADEKLTVGKRFIQKEGFAIPCVVTGTITVRNEIFFCKITFRVIVVGKIHHTPIAILPCFSCGTDDSTCLTAAVRRFVAIHGFYRDFAQMESPFVVQIQFYSFHIDLLMWNFINQ